MTTPEPSDFLLLPIRDFDLIIVYRASDISKPYYINYREFIKAITANITPASALLLQTNGVDNPTQSLLNLVQGTGITITDDGSGNITITNTGSGGVYTASNGVYESPSGNFTLGSSTLGPSVFTSNRYISAATYSLVMVGTGAASVIELINSSTGRGINVTTVSGTGVNSTANSGTAVGGKSTSGSAGTFTSTSYYGLTGASTSGVPALFSNNYTTAVNDIRTSIEMLRNTSSVGSSANGAGVSLDALVYTSSNVKIGDLRFYITDITTSTENAAAILRLINAGTLEDKITVLNTGQVQLNDYGSGTFNSEPIYDSGYTASGEIVEYKGLRKLLSSATASASSSIDFENVYSSLYSRFILEFDNVVPSTTGDLQLIMGTGTSPVTYHTGATDYRWASSRFYQLGTGTSVASFNQGDGQDSQIVLLLGVASTTMISGSITILNANDTSLNLWSDFRLDMFVSASNLLQQYNGSGLYNTTGSALTGLRIKFSAGNITSGTFRLYGTQ